MTKLIEQVLSNQAISSAIVSLILASIGYLIMKINHLSSYEESNHEIKMEAINSTRRISLRTEYLSIYNSHTFTDEQKYGMTREIVEEYESLHGNHYIHTLDTELKERLGLNDETN